jgi:predicted phosphodiesterase
MRVRYLVVSDIHSNLVAFEAVLNDASPFEAVWCLGDVVGYGPQPNECIERLRALPFQCVAGNHDWASISKLDTSDFNPDAVQAALWTRDQLTRDNWKFIQELPEKLVEGDFTLVHGSPRHPIWEYITHPGVAAQNFSCFDTAYCFFGHTHEPAVYLSLNEQDSEREELPELVQRTTIHLDRHRWLINPGGVGQPRDRDPRASYMLLDPQARTLEYRRVEYPVEETQRLMRAAGLPPRLVERLEYGW